MSDLTHKGMFIDPIRVGAKGEWAAKWGCGDFWQTTIRFGGKGAKAKAIQQAKEDADKWTPQMIEEWLWSSEDDILSGPDPRTRDRTFCDIHTEIRMDADGRCSECEMALLEAPTEADPYYDPD